MASRPGSSRRDFLKLVGGSLGGLVLSSCGGGGEVSPSGGGGLVGTPLPNAYKFFRVYTPGAPILPDVSVLTPQVFMDDAGHVFFYGRNARGQYALHALTVDYSQNRAVEARTIAAAGQAMPDGRIVSTLGAVDVNSEGQVALVLNFDTTQGTPGQGPTCVVMDRGRGQGLEPIIEYGDEVAGNHGEYGGDFGDLDLHGDDLMLVSRYSGDGHCSQGLFYLPSARPSEAKIVLSTDSSLPYADAAVNGIGLIDLGDGGEFLAQGYGTPSTAVEASPDTFILQGNVNQSLSEARLLAAGATLPLTRAATDASLATGTSLHGPRLLNSRLTSTITENASQVLTLYRNGVAIAQSGRLSPGGSPMMGLMPAVLHSSGLAYYQVITDDGIELCVHNGLSAAVLFRRGAIIDGAVVDTIAFGCHTSQADSTGRIVTYVQMADGQESILVGIPV